MASLVETLAQAASLDHAVQRANRAREKFENRKPTREAIENFNSLVKIGIVAALPIEFEAVTFALSAPSKNRKIVVQRIALENPVNLPFRQTAFLFTPSSDILPENLFQPFVVVAMQATKMGNNSSAVAATYLLSQYSSIDDIIMTGIAGGIHGYSNINPNRTKVHLGDVVISNRPIVQYDHITQTVSDSKLRYLPNSVSPRFAAATAPFSIDQSRPDPAVQHFLHESCRALGDAWRRPSPRKDKPRIYERDEQGELIATIPRKSPRSKALKGHPQIHLDGIGSANILLKDPFRRDQIAEELGVRAIEMEGSGVSDAAWHFTCGYGVIRSVCDYCDVDKNDDWQKYSSVAAAAVTRTVIEQMMCQLI